MVLRWSERLPQRSQARTAAGRNTKRAPPRRVSPVSPVLDRKVPPRSPAGGDDGGINTRKDASELVAGGARTGRQVRRGRGRPRRQPSGAKQGPGGRFTEDGGDLGGNHRGQSRDREVGSPRTGATSEGTIGRQSRDRKSMRAGPDSGPRSHCSWRRTPGRRRGGEGPGLRGPLGMARKRLSVRPALGRSELGRPCRTCDVLATHEPLRGVFMDPSRLQVHLQRLPPQHLIHLGSHRRQR